VNVVEQREAVHVLDGRGRFDLELELNVLQLGQQTVDLRASFHRKDEVYHLRNTDAARRFRKRYLLPNLKESPLVKF